LATPSTNTTCGFYVHADYDSIDAKGIRLPPDVATNLYRVTQEALHNVYTHARDPRQRAARKA
jgi:signal transduction histidine kinase